MHEAFMIVSRTGTLSCLRLPELCWDVVPYLNTGNYDTMRADKKGV